MLERFHAKTVHPSRFGLKVRPFLHVHGHVEGFTGEQIQPQAHVLALSDITADVHRQGVNEIVDDAPEIDQVAQEEREALDAFFLAKGWKFKPIGIHIRRQCQGDIRGQGVKIHLPVESEERVVVGGFVLKGDAERRGCASDQTNLGIAFGSE